MNKDEFKTLQTSLIDGGFKLANENSPADAGNNKITCVIIGVEFSKLPSTVRAMVENGQVMLAVDDKEANKILRLRGLLPLMEENSPHDPEELIDNIMKSAENLKLSQLDFIDPEVLHAGGSQEYKRKKQSEKYRSRR